LKGRRQAGPEVTFVIAIIKDILRFCREKGVSTVYFLPGFFGIVVGEGKTHE
jgi:hypothetical protein